MENDVIVLLQNHKLQPVFHFNTWYSLANTDQFWSADLSLVFCMTIKTEPFP